MSSRTASLCMLSIVALGVSAVLVAMFESAGTTIGHSTPWVVPVVAAVCYTLTFYLGRRFILPHRLAHPSTRAMLTIVSLVMLSMAIVFALISMLRATFGGLPGPWPLVLWLAVLWGGFDLVHRLTKSGSTPMR